MTVIAYRNGILAADRLVTDSEGYRTGLVTKIAGNPAMGIGGCAGPLSYMSHFRTWIAAGHPDAPFEPGHMEWEALLIRPDGEAWFFDEGGSAPIEAESHAIGSGAVGAMVAMAAGCSAREAVEACCKVLTACGGGVDTLTLDQLKAP